MATVFEQLEGYSVSLLVAAMFIGVIAQILFRFIDVPVVWLQEASTLAFTWLIFLGAAAGHRRGFKISIDILVARASPPVRRRIRLATEALTLAFLVVIAAVGLWLMWAQRLFTTPTMEIPVYVFTAPLPLSIGLMAIHTARVLRHEWRDARADS